MQAQYNFETVQFAAAKIEFQLINDINHGIIARLFIPASKRGKNGSFKGRVVYDSDRAAVKCNHKSRTIEFVATHDEYQRLFALYGANSNIAANRVRTIRLLNTMAQPLPAPEVDAAVSEVAVALENNDVAAAAVLSADHDVSLRRALPLDTAIAAADEAKAIAQEAPFVNLESVPESTLR